MFVYIELNWFRVGSHICIQFSLKTLLYDYYWNPFKCKYESSDLIWERTPKKDHSKCFK